MNIVFQIHHCGRFTDIAALKTIDSYCYFISQEEKRGPGQSPRKIVKLTLFLLFPISYYSYFLIIQNHTFCYYYYFLFLSFSKSHLSKSKLHSDKEGALQKGHFFHLLKGWRPRPPRPPSCAPAVYTMRKFCSVACSSLGKLMQKLAKDADSVY